MQAWAVGRPGPVASGPLERIERAVPHAGPGQVRVAVHACGVCRTDLHLAEGDLAPRRPLVVPGHEVVGAVDELGAGCTRVGLGDRVGIAWLGRSCGTCRYCRLGRENLCAAPIFTGWDRDGGYAPYAVADEDFVYAIPPGFSDEHAAPLLCAGIIGYRALHLSGLQEGGRLGIYGFGASAHLTAQIALHRGARVHVMTRSNTARELALALGAHSAVGFEDPPAEPLDAAIVFAPTGSIVPVALAALDRGGTLAIAGIHMSPIPGLDYASQLFEERGIRSVTANTRQDGRELLALAAEIPLEVATTPYPMARADAALADLAAGDVRGVAVLLV